MHYILQMTLCLSGYGEICLQSEHETINQAAEADSLFREIISKWKKNKDLELRCDGAKNVTSDWDRFIILRGSLIGVKMKIIPGDFLSNPKTIIPGSSIDATFSGGINTYEFRGVHIPDDNPMADAIHEDLDPT